MSSIHKIQIDESNSYYQTNKIQFCRLLDIINSSKSTLAMKNQILTDDELLNWVNSCLPQLNNCKLYTKVNWIITNRQDFPICNFCRNVLSSIDIPIFGHYHKWCSSACKNKDPEFKKKIADSFESKYGKGVRSNFQIPGMKDKIKTTWKTKYGTDNPFSLDLIKNKKKNTFIEHYGVDNNMKSKRGLAEYTHTMNEKYGIDYTWQLSSVCTKSKQTIIERYGVDNAAKLQSTKEKQANTNIQRYGVRSALWCEESQQKSRQTCILKYGVDHPMKNSEVRRKSRSKYTYDGIVFDSSWEVSFWIYCKDNNIEITHEPLSFSYVDSLSSSHVYFPDFMINGNQLIEIKGDDQFAEDGKMIDKLDHSRDYIAEAKHQCMLQHNVKILKGQDMKTYLDYIDQKYGKNYLKQFKNVKI